MLNPNEFSSKIVTHYNDDYTGQVALANKIVEALPGDVYHVTPSVGKDHSSVLVIDLKHRKLILSCSWLHSDTVNIRFEGDKESMEVDPCETYSMVEALFYAFIEILNSVGRGRCLKQEALRSLEQVVNSEGATPGHVVSWVSKTVDPKNGYLLNPHRPLHFWTKEAKDGLRMKYSEHTESRDALCDMLGITR